jgi:hypothetical protein
MYDRADRPDRLDDDCPASPFDDLETDTIDPTEEIVLRDLDDLPTVEDISLPVRFAPHVSGGRGAQPRARDFGQSEVLSTSLPIDAATAYEAFCRAESIPSWLSVVQSVRVLSRTRSGRPARAAFVGRLQRGTIGYTLFYRYREAERAVSWGTAAGSMTLVAGRAQFIPLGERATLMQYQLAFDLPEDALPDWSDPFLSGHTTSVVMNDFREYVIRTHRS